MKSTEREIRDAWKAGDIVYAFDARLPSWADGVPAPVKAVLLAGWTQEAHLIALAKREDAPTCFAPCGDPSEPPDWSRVRGLEGWDFADTEDEIADIRRMRIHERIHQLESEIKALDAAAAEGLPGPTGTMADPDPVWRFAPGAGYEAVREAMDCDMTLKPDFDGVSVYSWDTFTKLASNGDINDHDGVASIVIDGMACSNAQPLCYLEMLWIYDRYMVPWSRIPEMFAGHEIQVHWFPK